MSRPSTPDPSTDITGFHLQDAVKRVAWRTHADASLVLLVLGLLLIGNAFGAVVWHRALAEDRRLRLRRDGRTEPGVDRYAGD